MASHPILQRFYASKRWRDFREVILMEVILNEQCLMCEYCNKTIETSDQATLHHKIELTIDNVDDTNISLNPDNILVVHNACHSIIHDRFGNRKERKVFLVYGPPMAGKSTYVMKYKQHDDMVVDVDKIYSAITGLNAYDKPNALLNNVLAVRDTLLDNIRTRYGKWNNAWIIGGYADIYMRDKIINELGAEPILITTTKEICMARLMEDEQRMKLGWDKYIDKWFDKFTPPQS